MITNVKIIRNLESSTIIAIFDSNSNVQVKNQLIFAVKISSSNETDHSCNDGNGSKGNSSSCLPNYFLRPASTGAVGDYIDLKDAVISLTAAIGFARREVTAVASLAPAMAVAVRHITIPAIALA